MNADWIEYQVELKSKGVLERTGITIGKNEYLTVRSKGSNVTAMCWGITVGDIDTNVSTTIATNTATTTPVWNTTSPLPDVINGEGTATRLSVVDAGTVTYSLTSGSLPAGLTLNPTTGTLDGATTSGAYTAGGVASSVTIAASNGTNSASRVFNITKRWRDGSTWSSAASSAQAIKNLTGTTSDGTYWIKLPSGPCLTYCIMNNAVASGGWMLAMKGNRGTTFAFDSAYWSTVATLNDDDVSRSLGNSKYRIFNDFSGTEIAAVFPDVNAGGTMGSSAGGWTWRDTMPVSGTLLNLFAAGTQYVKLTGSSVSSSSFYSGSQFSNQTGYQWYGFNYADNNSQRVRWGFGWNNETGPDSNDVTGGIGVKSTAASAGDFIYCCQVNSGVNRQMAMEVYVR